MMIIDACELGRIQCTDDGYGPDGAGIANSASSRRFALVARPLAQDQSLAEPVDMSTAQELQAALLLGVVFGSLIWIPLALVLCLFLLPVPYTVAVFALLVCLSLLLPRLMWPPYRLPAHLRLLLHKYFSLKIVSPPATAFSPQQQYIFAGVPTHPYRR